MEFRTEAQRACYQKIARMMRELFGEFAAFSDTNPVIGVAIGSAWAQAAVLPWSDHDAVICTRSYVVRGAELAPDLLLYLLKSNAAMRFGAFGIDDDGDILFQHAIVGSTCDKEELKSSVLAVVGTADRYDDEIIRRWGGQRAIDR